MTLIVAGGAEEQNIDPVSSYLLGAFAGVMYTNIDTNLKYTGAACYIFKGGASGGSAQSSQGAKGLWSYAAYLPQWGNGTHRSMWSLGSDGYGLVRLGWAKGASNDEHQIRLVTRTGTYDSVAEFSYGQWHRIKVEFDNGVWTIWASDNGAAFAEVLSRDDSGTYTELSVMHMSVNSTTDESKEANSWYRADDCLFWDGAGDNWNSRIGAQDFPRISEAHMPVTPDSEGGSPEWQNLDEIPPDGVAFASDDFPNYWTTVEDFKPTGETIQAVMVTRVDEATVWGGELWKFNVREGGVLSADSAEGRVQQGAGVASNYVTWAGYYPWTPGEVNWTPDIFEACQYGCSLVSGETDQLTAQVIFGGSSHWWEPPPGLVELSGTIPCVSVLSAELFRTRPLSGAIAGISAFSGDLSVWRRPPPLLADAIARAEHIPIFADAWQQPKEPPNG